MANTAPHTQSASVPKPGTGGGRASGGATKRTRPEHATPSPSTNRLDKRPKNDGSYAQATKGIIRMALAPEGYPEKRLSVDEAAEIRKLIRTRILGLSEDAMAPTFIGTWVTDGALIVSCANKESEEWLRSHSSDWKIRETPLRVLAAGELPKRHRVVIHVEEPDIEVEEALRLLSQQNTGLATREWVVVRGSRSRDALGCAHFACLIGDSSLGALKNCGLRPFCGLGRASVKVLPSRERGEEIEHMEVSEGVETA